MSTTSRSIRRARYADAAEIYRLARLFTPGLGLAAADFDENFQSLIKDPNWFICVAGSSYGLTGYAAAQDYGRGLRTTFTVGRMHDLFVEPAGRRTGIGKELVEEVFHWARRRPFPMILDWQATPESIAFYESFGMEADFIGDFPECPGFSLDLRPIQ
ncbi:ribosomal protein S18 acetylase RimI-like enzyme [Glutamicibacter mysorens]|uniref:Ribosomal protein S18 acetylase RimI-like enzyme n=1 Tax=Glutamicibacter mysorens TaxID=257984 RepID=A0ABX4MVN5_9MICC|nr:GNAT family N-acetyltransferase [Glutamicibacter mysorens]PJJ43368.1 ribosomal protein S18 acetylase RimI-like enzyme [Glutamicibacter mysorens]